MHGCTKERQSRRHKLTLNEHEQFLLGAEILVPLGKQELFNSGTLHYYQYGHLYPNNGSKIIARSTTQRRMTESAEYFLAGFFGLGWAQNATLELVIEWNGFNNTMAGYKACNRSSWGAAEKGAVIPIAKARLVHTLTYHSQQGVGGYIFERCTRSNHGQPFWQS